MIKEYPVQRIELLPYLITKVPSRSKRMHVSTYIDKLHVPSGVYIRYIVCLLSRSDLVKNSINTFILTVCSYLSRIHSTIQNVSKPPHFLLKAFLTKLIFLVFSPGSLFCTFLKYNTL